MTVAIMQHLPRTWQHQILEYLCSSRRGVDETNMSILQSFLAVIPPQSGNRTLRHKLFPKDRQEDCYAAVLT